MDFAPGEACLALQQLAKDFARQEILPRTDALDQEERPENRLPKEVLITGSRLGLRTLPLPESHGGGGVDLLSLCFVGEEIGWGDLGVGVIHAQDWALAHAIFRLWDAAGCKAFAERFTNDHASRLGHAQISPTPSPEEKRPYKSTNGLQVASIRREERESHLHGVAPHVPGGAAARFFLLESAAPREGSRQIFLLDKQEERGIRVAHYHDSMGMRSCPDVDLHFENVPLRPRQRVDCAEEAWRSATHAARILPAAAAIGTARKSDEQALRHARERVQGGKPIIEHQTVGFMLCDNAMELDAARRSLQAAAWAAERGENPDPKQSFLAKALATEVCERVARRSMEVWGGAGYMTEAPMERLLRDLVRFSHSFGLGHAMRSAAMGMM